VVPGGFLDLSAATRSGPTKQRGEPV